MELRERLAEAHRRFVAGSPARMQKAKDRIEEVLVEVVGRGMTSVEVDWQGITSDMSTAEREHLHEWLKSNNVRYSTQSDLRGEVTVRLTVLFFERFNEKKPT